MSDSTHRTSVRPIHNINHESATADGRSDCDRVFEGGRDGDMQCAEVLVGESGPGDVEQPTGEEELHAEAGEEVAKVAQLPTYSPTRSEVEEHNVTHTPYRPWSKFCNEGRGQEHGHFRRKGVDSNRVPLVSFDYKPLSDAGDVGGLKYDPEDESTTCVLVVAIRTNDDRQTCVFGYLVPAKGVDMDKFSVDCIVGDILWTGYTKVLLKSDNEPANV